MSTQSSRREFLQDAALTVSSVSAIPYLCDTGFAANQAEPLPIVDTHQHLWDLKLFRLPWLASDGVQKINRSFVTSDYLAATRGSNVVKTVYMEVNVAPDQQTREAEYVIKLCRDSANPMAAAVIGGSPQNEEFNNYITPLAQNPEIKGVRTVLHDPDRPQGMCLTPTFVRNIKRLGELGMSFDLCMRPGEISDGVKLARKCPETRFIIDHCGNMSVTSQDQDLRSRWMDGIRAAAKLDNVICKISGIVVTANESWKPRDLAANMNFCLDAFGPDKVIFGGDWPVCTLRSSYRSWVEALKWIVKDRSRVDQKKLFHDNAIKFYGLG